MLARYRNLAVPLAIVAAIDLFYMQNPWFFPASDSTERTIATVVFWVLAIVVLALMFEDRKSPEAQTVEVEGPAFARYLFSNTRAGLIWLPIRIFVGFEWLEAGWHKLTGGGLDRWGREPARLLAERCQGPRQSRQAADQLRVVPHLPAAPYRQRRPGLVRLADHPW